MAICPNCGAANDDGTKFCTSCGGPLPVTQQPQPVQPVYQQPSQPAYQQPVVQQPVPQQPVYNQSVAAQPAGVQQTEKNGMSTAGFVLSLIGIFTFGITSLFGLIFSIVGLIASGKKNKAGKGKAIAGIIMSAFMIVVMILVTVLLSSSLTDYVDRSERTRDEIRTSSTVNEPDDKPVSDYEKRIVKFNWITRGDGSYLTFNRKDKSFKYYMTYTDTSDNYYSGHYQIYTGKDAVDYITEDLEDMGVTRSELRQLFRDNEMYDEENLICICLDNEELITDGTLQDTDPWTTHYYGFYLINEVDGKKYEILDLAGMESASYYTFLREDQYGDYMGSGYITETSARETFDITETSDTYETTEYTEVSSTFDYGDYDTMGDSITGVVALTQGNWADWYEADSIDSYYESRYQKFNMETQTIINLTVFTGEYDDASAKTYADISYQDMESQGCKQLENKKTSIGGYSAYEVSGMYQDGMYLSVWYFTDRNNKLHFISVEYYPDDVASYEMVRDTYRLD